MAELLVSVRSAEEARAALTGGTSLIDVKEPARGSLGRAADGVIAAVVQAVAGRRPVSAAMGELTERNGKGTVPYAAGLSYLKWGLAGCGGWARWPAEWAETVAPLRETNVTCQAVVVAYADWRLAESPPPEEVCAFACSQACAALLLDTWCKDGKTLLDWLAPAEIGHFCHACQQAGVRIALAGSLGEAEVVRLRACKPDWFAVRGSVCTGGRREQEVDARAVRRLANLIKDG